MTVLMRKTNVIVYGRIQSKQGRQVSPQQVRLLGTHRAGEGVRGLGEALVQGDYGRGGHQGVGGQEVVRLEDILAVVFGIHRGVRQIHLCLVFPHSCAGNKVYKLQFYIFFPIFRYLWKLNHKKCYGTDIFSNFHLNIFKSFRAISF